jgi:hypothetical protein
MTINIVRVWSVSCNGTLSAGIIGGKKLRFKVDVNNAIVAVSSETTNSAKLKRSEISGEFFELQVVPLV